MDAYDFIVIGSGPAGYHAALQAREFGKRVLVVERQPLVGGTSVHTGTIPSKTLREAALFLTGFRQRAFYGIDFRVDQHITIADLASRVGSVIRTETAQVAERLRHHGVEIAHGFASFLDPHRVRIEGEGGAREAAGERILIATGSRPAHSEAVPADGTRILDTDMLPNLRRVPASLAIVGGGVIGIEYASIAAALGIPTTVLDTRERLLDFADGEIVERLIEHLKTLGVVFRLGVKVERAERAADGGTVTHLENGASVRAETILYAVGRQANTDRLNLAAAGLEADARGRLCVDGCYRTAVPHIYAAGDVIGFPSLASVSMDQGRLAAFHAFDRPAGTLSKLLPFGIYSVPEISFVGRTEEQLREAGVRYRALRAHYRDTARGQMVGDTTGMLKLLFDPDTREVLGVHIIGESAADLIHIGQAVMALGGTLDYFLDNAFNYPTLAECYKTAALTADDPVMTATHRAEAA